MTTRSPAGSSAQERVDDLSRPGFVAVAVLVSLLSFAGAATAGGLVTSRDVKDRSLLSRDLKDGRAVKGVDVKDGSLTPPDLGPLPRGAQGDPGPKGATGIGGLDLFTYEISAAHPIQVGETESFEAPCPPGRMVVGGGASANSHDVEIVGSLPVIPDPPTNTRWSIQMRNTDSFPVNGFAWAVCVAVP